MSKVYVSLTVDDLEARDDLARSDRCGGYDATPEEIQEILKIIRQIRSRNQARFEAREKERLAKMTPEQIRAEAETAERIRRDNKAREEYNNRYGDAAN
jgi:pyruvate-formate lyase-activating enzyme